MPCTVEQPGELMIQVQRSIELNNWILHYGVGVEVVTPVELRAHIASVVSRMNSYYSENE